jgi:hypothetical protein
MSSAISFSSSSASPLSTALMPSRKPDGDTRSSRSRIAFCVCATSSANSRVCVASFPASDATCERLCDSSEMADVILPPSGMC